MAERIKRADVARMAKSFKGGDFDKLSSFSGSNFQKLQKVLVTNQTGGDLQVGQPVWITGISSTEQSYDNLFSEHETNGFLLNGGAYDSSRSERPVAFALEPIKANGIGEAYLDGVTAGIVTGDVANKKYAEISSGGFSASDSGRYYIIGYSNTDDNNKRFAYFYPHVKSECRLWITNDGASTIHAGDFVGIHAMTDSDLDPEEAIDNWVNEGIRANAKLIGDIDDASAGRLIRATSLDDISPGDTGRAESPWAFMARIWRDPNEYGPTERCTARAEWRTVLIGRTEVRRLACVRYPGEYILIDAAGPGDDDYLFGLLTPSLPGHIISGIVSVDVESKRVTLSCGLTASFPVGVISSELVGKKAAVSRGIVNREWEILAVKEDD